MNMNAFKKFTLYYVGLLVILFIIYILILFMFNKPKPHTIELIMIFSICLMTCLIMGCIGSYLSKQQTVVYNIKNDSIAIDMITKTLNKSGYNCSNDIKDHYEGEIVYSSKTQSAGFYGKVFVTTYQDTIEVKAPRILFIKYLNKLKIERQ